MSTEPLPRSCPSELTLERLRQGELSAEAVPLEAHVRDCLTCRRLLEELQAPPPVLTPALPGRRRLPVALAAGLGALAAAGLVLWVRPAPDTVSKGPPWQLAVIARDRDGRVMKVDPGAPLSPGDRLRFEVFTHWPQGQVAILSIDGAGTVSPLVPPAGATLAVTGGQRTLLDGAVELDGSMTPERILLVACHQARAVPELVGAARQALARAGGQLRQMAHLDLDCHEEAFWINKVPR